MNVNDPSPMTALPGELAGPRARQTIGAALLVTLAIGVWLRWSLATTLPLPAPFGNARHAHSHLGYFGLLFPLAWLGWRAAGVAVPGPRISALYAAVGALPNSRPVALAAIYMAVLGRLLTTAAPLWLRRPLASRWWWLQLLFAGQMSLALVAQSFGAGPWTWTAAAMGGTGVLVFWLVQLTWSGAHNQLPETNQL